MTTDEAVVFVRQYIQDMQNSNGELYAYGNSALKAFDMVALSRDEGWQRLAQMQAVPIPDINEVTSMLLKAVMGGQVPESLVRVVEWLNKVNGLE